MSWTAPSLRRSLAAILLVILATVVRVGFLQSLAMGHPFLVYYPAVVIAALFCQLAGGLLATVLSVLSADYFWMEPAGTLFIRDPDDQLAAAVFLLEGFIVSYAAEIIRRTKVAEAQARIAAERQQADEKLRESEQRLRLALEGGQMGMWEWDIGSNRFELNEKEFELLGFPKGDGHVPPELFPRSLHPDDASAFKRALDEVTERGSDFVQEFRIVRPDGEVRWLAAKGRLFRDADGKPSRMVGVSYDITSQRLAEEGLRHSEAEARARADELAVLMDTVPAMTFIAHDPECRHMSCSRKARQFMRVPEGENVSMSAPADERPPYRTTKDGKELAPEHLPVQMAARGNEVRDFELTLLFDDGTSRDILGDAVPLFDESGQVRGSIGVFLDITERKKIESERQNETEERIQALDALRKRDQLLIQQGRLAAMGEMISNIAHQWRQPLNTVGLIVQELPAVYKTGGFSEEYLNAKVDKAKELIIHMSQTIEDFMNFFRPNRVREEFKARDVVVKTLSLIEESFNSLQIKFEVDAAGDPVIYGYPNECSQVLLNIFLNSRDAFLERKKDEPRTIRVRTFCQDDKTVVAIADNAGGIPEEIIGKIFEPYFTTKGPDKGTGVGLFMAKNIIEKHMDGRLTVSNIGDGVEFRIEIDSVAPH